MSTLLQGLCHCRALSFSFQTNQDPADLNIRACQCGFCRAHGAAMTSDPDGWVDLAAVNLQRYRFGLQTADFWVCRTCGVYLCAVMEVDGRSYATLNMRPVAGMEAALSAPEAVSYDGETAEARTARRAARWTPVRRMEIL